MSPEQFRLYGGDDRPRGSRPRGKPLRPPQSERRAAAQLRGGHRGGARGSRGTRAPVCVRAVAVAPHDHNPPVDGIAGPATFRSPLTDAQLDQVMAAEHQAVIVVGTRANGLDQLIPALESIEDQRRKVTVRNWNDPNVESMFRAMADDRHRVAVINVHAAPCRRRPSSSWTPPRRRPGAPPQGTIRARAPGRSSSSPTQPATVRSCATSPSTTASLWFHCSDGHHVHRQLQAGRGVRLRR